MKNAADKKRIILDLIMKNKLICFSAVVAFFICIMIPSELSAFGSKDVGTTGAAFLKLGYGARPAGMGEAFSAVSGDINSLYYNPAGLYDVSNKTISFMHLNWLLDINYNVLSFVTPIKDYGVFGAAISSLDYGSIEKTVETGNPANPYYKDGKYSAYDRMLHLSYADKFKFFNKFAKYGIGAKLIHQKIDKESAQGIAFDLGMQYDFNEDFSAGALIQNFGRLSKFESENDKMPLNLKLGVSYKFFDDRFLTALDVNIPNDNEIYANLGVELFVLPKNYDFNFGVRAGYNGIESDRKGYSVGLGFNLMNFDLDYAFLPFTELGNTHRFSLNYLFGKRTEPKLKIQEQKKNAELEALIKIMQLSKPALTSLPDKKDAEIKPSQYPVFHGYSVDAATTESNEKYDKPENVKVVPPPVSIEKKIPPVEFILSSIKRDYPIEPEKYSQEKSSGLKLTEEEFALKQLLKNGYSRIIYFQSRTAKSVFIAGSFNDWRREPLTYDFVSGVWFCELNIPAGRYFYKFIVDGNIIPDANNIHFQLDGIEGINSILYLDFTE